MVSEEEKRVLMSQVMVDDLSEMGVNISNTSMLDEYLSVASSLAIAYTIKTAAMNEGSVGKVGPDIALKFTSALAAFMALALDETADIDALAAAFGQSLSAGVRKGWKMQKEITQASARSIASHFAKKQAAAKS